jgi:hypothetical protein
LAASRTTDDFHLLTIPFLLSELPALDQRLTAIKNLVWNLPPAHFALLKRLMEHLEQVTDFEESNQMPPQSLAMCFAPSLMRPPSDRGGMDVALINVGKAAKLIKVGAVAETA